MRIILWEITYVSKGSGSHYLRLGDKVNFTSAFSESGTSQNGGISGGNGVAKIQLASISSNHYYNNYSQE